ncbi:MAG: phosphoribosyltransferase family protein [Desulfurococcaceae archaeon TW002]
MLSDIRLMAIELLRAYKKILKYRELEELTGLSAPGLWRYINKRIRPTKERSLELFELLTNQRIVEEILRSKLLEVGDNIVNLSPIIYEVPILKILSYVAYKEFHRYNVNAVVTVEVDGIPLGVMIADILESKLVIVRKRPEVGIKNYNQVSYIARDPPAVITLFMPSDSLKAYDRVLIVDDLLNSGRTSLALVKLIRMSGAAPVGLFSVVAIGEKWRDLLENEIDKIHVVLRLSR